MSKYIDTHLAQCICCVQRTMFGVTSLHLCEGARDQLRMPSLEDRCFSTKPSHLLILNVFECIIFHFDSYIFCLQTLFAESLFSSALLYYY